MDWPNGMLEYTQVHYSYYCITAKVMESRHEHLSESTMHCHCASCKCGKKQELHNYVLFLFSKPNLTASSQKGFLERQVSSCSTEQEPGVNE